MDHNEAIRLLLDQAIGPCMNGFELSASLTVADRRPGPLSSMDAMRAR